MLYREIIAVCSQIHTKHIKYSVWAERYTSDTYNKYRDSNDQHTCTQHDICHSRIQLLLQRSCKQHSSHFFSSFVRSEIDRLSVSQFEERRRDIMTFHRRVKKATGHVKVVVARELQINRQDEWGCCLWHRTGRYCRHNFTLAAINTGLESRPSIKTKRMLWQTDLTWNHYPH